MASCAASDDLIASISREISPLEAIERSGFKGSPGFGEKSSSTESNPVARASSRGVSFASNSDCRKPRSRRLERMFSDSFGAALVRNRRRVRPASIDFGARRFNLVAQSFEFLVASFDFAQLFCSSFAKRDHVGDRTAIFAFQRFEERDAIFERSELFRIKIELLGVLATRTRDLRKLDDAGRVRLGEQVPALDRFFPALEAGAGSRPVAAKWNRPHRKGGARSSQPVRPGVCCWPRACSARRSLLPRLPSDLRSRFRSPDDEAVRSLSLESDSAVLSSACSACNACSFRKRASNSRTASSAWANPSSNASCRSGERID